MQDNDRELLELAAKQGALLGIPVIERSLCQFPIMHGGKLYVPTGQAKNLDENTPVLVMKEPDDLDRIALADIWDLLE